MRGEKKKKKPKAIKNDNLTLKEKKSGRTPNYYYYFSMRGLQRIFASSSTCKLNDTKL